MKLKKYKWHIIGYVLYLTVLVLLMPEDYFSSSYKSEFWKYSVGLAITVPLVLYIFVTLYRNKRQKGDVVQKQSKVDAPNADGKTAIEEVNKVFEKTASTLGIDIEGGKLQYEWPLLDFIKSYGKLQIGEALNKETGKIYHCCIFTNEKGKKIIANFYSKMGELSASQISEKQHNLKVGVLDTGGFILYENWFGKKAK
ncbi:MAG: hypothetical protein K6B45_11415 [Bacteroidaceae bacterium]|nr:hypothetical protein [Bacteroidaceae bacterium]